MQICFQHSLIFKLSTFIWFDCTNIYSWAPTIDCLLFCRILSCFSVVLFNFRRSVQMFPAIFLILTSGSRGDPNARARACVQYCLLSYLALLGIAKIIAERTQRALIIDARINTKEIWMENANGSDVVADANVCFSIPLVQILLGWPDDLNASSACR